MDKMKDDIALSIANSYLQILFNKEQLKVQKNQKLVAKLRTPFVLSLIISILFTGISNIDLKIFIISCIIVLSTIVLYREQQKVFKYI